MRANLFRVGKVWHYRFTIDGKRVRRSTNQTARDRAQAIADEAYREASLWARNGRAIPTLRECVVQWLAAHRLTASRSHLQSVEVFGRLHLYDLSDISIDNLTTSAVESARDAHLETHAPISVNLWIKVIRLVCNWAVQRDVIPRLPFKVKLLRVQKKPRALLPLDLTHAWLAAIDATADDGICIAVRLMIGMGLRESETITARWEWIDWLRFTYSPGITKGKESVALPMPAWLTDYLRPIRQVSGLMVHKDDGKPFARGFTRTAMARANEAVGISGITAHRCRGTYATLLSENGAPIQAIQAVMRHKSPLTTINYLETDLITVSRAQERIAMQYEAQSTTNAKQQANNATQSHAG